MPPRTRSKPKSRSRSRSRSRINSAALSRCRAMAKSTGKQCWLPADRPGPLDRPDDQTRCHHHEFVSGECGGARVFMDADDVTINTSAGSSIHVRHTSQTPNHSEDLGSGHLDAEDDPVPPLNQRRLPVTPLNVRISTPEAAAARQQRTNPALADYSHETKLERALGRKDIQPLQAQFGPDLANASRQHTQNSIVIKEGISRLRDEGGQEYGSQSRTGLYNSALMNSMNRLSLSEANTRIMATTLNQQGNALNQQATRIDGHDTSIGELWGEVRNLQQTTSSLPKSRVHWESTNSRHTNPYASSYDEGVEDV